MTLLQLAPLLPLKRIAAIRSSNVDKVVKDNEIPIRLCNYVDVYYNDQIHPALEFAAGSAKQSEIDRFGLRPGDVLITKDSETPDDIAVPALVVQGADDLVCGYHLALLRPNPSRLNGKFLFYALKSRSLQAAFSVLAQGITRFGLTLVVQGADDLVCGYHLALLRPNPSRLNGKFLFYALKSRSLQAAFSVLAQGITRFGLR